MSNRFASPAGAIGFDDYRRFAGDNAERLRSPLPGDGWGPLWTGLARVGGLLPPAGRTNEDPWALLGRRGDASGSGRADGGALGTIGRRMPFVGPRFDTIVPPGGYGWWYVDAISADRRYGLTIIGFVGSVFSPYFRESGRGDPQDHVSINVALYGPRGNRWCMTERPRERLWRTEDTFSVGPSMMRWEGGALVIDLAETGSPIPWKVKGSVRLYPENTSDTAFALDDAGRHVWHPIAPRARVEVDMASPDVCWSGSGYFDSNFGSEALEDGFSSWQWSRAHLKNEVAVIYEGERRDGSEFAMALRFDRNAHWHDAPLPPKAHLMPTPFLMPRRTRGRNARVRKTWVNAPFYSRSAITTELYGERVDAVHESLSLNRFVNPVVQKMLPYKMPRRLS